MRHNVQSSGAVNLFSHMHLHVGLAAVRRYLPDLIDMIWQELINPARFSI